MIYLVGIAITLFLSLTLLTKRNKSNADILLVMWLFVVALHLSLYSLISTQKYLQFPYFLGIEIPIPLLHGPFLYLYTVSYTERKADIWKKLFHFAPFLVALLALIPFLVLNAEEKITVYGNEGESYAGLTSSIFISTILSGAIYTILSLRSLINHKRRIKNEYSYTEKINLQWLFNLIVGLCCIWVVVLFADDEYVFASVVLYVLFIGYFGIKQVGIFTNQPPLQEISSMKVTEPTVALPAQIELPKYEKSSLTAEQMDAIHRSLSQLMRQHKPYLIPELTLSMVAKAIDTHPNTLSQVINRTEQRNFFDYINLLRVEEFKERAAMPDVQKYTLLSLALECGFNSKTSFNRNFKKFTGKSPSEYLQDGHITLR